MLGGRAGYADGCRGGDGQEAEEGEEEAEDKDELYLRSFLGARGGGG